jgi:hypothetical protein
VKEDSKAGSDEDLEVCQKAGAREDSEKEREKSGRRAGEERGGGAREPRAFGPYPAPAIAGLGRMVWLILRFKAEA